MSFPGIGKSKPTMRARTLKSAPSLIAWMSFQPGIPGRVALQQSPLALHRPAPGYNRLVVFTNRFPANGYSSLISVSQPKGAVQAELAPISIPPPSLPVTSYFPLPLNNFRRSIRSRLLSSRRRSPSVVWDRRPCGFLPGPEALRVRWY
jgi:hypothetical protein